MPQVPAQRIAINKKQDLRPQSPAPRPEESLMAYIRTRASKHFNREETNLLLMLAEQKNQNLISAFELYSNDHDEADFLDVVQRIMKIQMQRMQVPALFRGDHQLHITPQKSDTVDLHVDGVESGGIQESDERLFERIDSLRENFVVHSVETLEDYNSVQGTGRDYEGSKRAGTVSAAPITPGFDRTIFHQQTNVTAQSGLETEKVTPTLPSAHLPAFNNFPTITVEPTHQQPQVPQHEVQQATQPPLQSQPVPPVSQATSAFNKNLFSSFSVSKEDKQRFLNSGRPAENSSSLAVPSLQVTEPQKEPMAGLQTLSSAVENPFMLSEQRGSISADTPAVPSRTTLENGEGKEQPSLAFATIQQGSQPSTPVIAPTQLQAAQPTKINMIRFNEAFTSFRGEDMRRLIRGGAPADKTAITEHKEEAESSPCKTNNRDKPQPDEAAANLSQTGFTFPGQSSFKPNSDAKEGAAKDSPQHSSEELAYFGQMLKFVLIHDGADAQFGKICSEYLSGGTLQAETFGLELENFAKNKFCKRLLGNITPMNLEEIIEKGELFAPVLEGYRREQTSVRMLADKLIDVFESNKELMNKGAKLKEVVFLHDVRVPQKPCMI